VRVHYNGRTTHSPGPIKRVVRDAGRKEYRKSMKRQKRSSNPEGVMVSISRRQLIAMSGLTNDGDSYKLIEAALNRLCRPIGSGKGGMPGVLRNWEEMPNGRMCLHVHGDWLPKNRFARVLWPTPKRSPAALALHLLVQVMRTGKINQKVASPGWLARKIGIDDDAPNSVKRRGLDGALDGVNKLLDELTDERVKRLWSSIPRVEPPQEFTLESFNDGSEIRILATSRRHVFVIDEDRERPVGCDYLADKSKNKSKTRRCRGPNKDTEKGAGVPASTEEKVQGSLQTGAGVLTSEQERFRQELLENIEDPEKFLALYKNYS